MPDYPQPQYPIVASMCACLDERQRELFEERAGIHQFDAGLDRPLAEALALLEVINRYGWPPNGRQ